MVAGLPLKSLMHFEFTNAIIPYDFCYIWNLKNKQKKLTKQTHRYREQTGSCQRERDGGQMK